MLQTLTKNAFPEIISSTLYAVDAGVLHYVYVGRNAWHSIWVTLYSEGCMHLSLESAKQYAERNRTQGSVFNIKELPCLILRSEGGSVFVTQINTQHPLKDYLATAVRSEPGRNLVLIENARNCYLEKGAQMQGAVLSFAWNSRFWEKDQPSNNSVIVVASNDPEEKAQRILSQEFQLRVSRSYGRNYLLGWREMQTKISAESVVRLAAPFA
ncbi:MAG: hypothetical protein EPN22_13755 [Nitrospirae bacterium]|nr:MAG: hypothetical protein EPN22_13755 [Nitrospirota bacterium]